MTTRTWRRTGRAGRVAGPQVALSVALWGTLVGTTFFLGVNGRLAADDYCNASRASSLGVASAVKSLFQSWHGGWSADLVISCYGYLVLHLPAAMGYVPFVVSTMVLIVLAARSAVVALGLAPSTGSGRWTIYVPVLATLLVVGLTAMTRDQDLIFGGFLWQAASVVHLWPTLLSVVLLVGVFELRHASGWRVTGGLVLAAAVVSGFNFTETSILAGAAAVLAIGSMVAGRLLPSREIPVRLARRYATIAGVAVIAFVVMYQAPGTAVRQATLGVPPSSLAKKASQFQEYVGILTASALGRPALLLAVALGVSFALMVRPSADRRALADRAALVSVVAGATGLLGIALAAAGEVASYPAPWHAFALIPWWLVSATGVGICLGAVIVTALEGVDARGLLPPLRVLTVIVPVLLSVLLAVLMVGWAGPLSARAATWDSGQPARIASLEDREAPWIATCWSRIVESGYSAGR